jgi:hypothetical protein
MLAESLATAAAAEAQHVGRHWGEFVTTIFVSGAGWSALAYGVDSFPNPTNKYGLWFINWIRALLNKRVSAGSAMDLANRVANQEQAKVTISATPNQTPLKGDS